MAEDGQDRKAGLTCEVCGRLPELREARLTVADVPAVLPLEILGAELVDGTPGAPASHLSADRWRLKVYSRRRGAVVLTRPGQPSTLAESARAHRLAELAEVVEDTGQLSTSSPTLAKGAKCALGGG